MSTGCVRLCGCVFGGVGKVFVRVGERRERKEKREGERRKGQNKKDRITKRKRER